MDNIIENLMCYLNERKTRHFLTNPKHLPCCNKIFCDQCILETLNTHVQPVLYHCSFCDSKTKIELNYDEQNRAVECKLKPANEANKALEKHLIDINDFLINKLEISLRNTEERFDSKETFLKKRQKFLSEEIHIQVETIKAQLDDLEEKMKDDLNQSCRNALINLEKFEKTNRHNLVDMINEIENLKLNASRLESNDLKNLSKVLQKQSVNKCLSNLSDLNKVNKTINEMINEIKFSPNSETPDKSIIGTLKTVKEINFVEQFKVIKKQTFISKIKSVPNQQMPITPKFICIADQFNLFFTDSQSKQLVQLSLDSGDFIRATNINGVLRNPDGICIQHRTGHIYISDSELNVVFKLDSQFNVIKKFGQKDLKWPRGLAFDSDDSDTPNRLYVCDYSNSRVAIYNEHEQLRDCLTVAINDSYKYADIDNEVKFCPFNITIAKSNIYVTDDWTGGNCIRVFDKKTHDLLRSVGDLNAWNPLGLIIDDNGNIFTIARLYYETGSTHLFCFNKNGELLYKTNLNLNSESICDIIIDNQTDRNKNRIICCGDKKLHYINF